jgi:flavin-dependent dehydrogenase
MPSETKKHDEMFLKNGSKVAVIGGGPTGTFFSIFALKMAKMIDLDLDLTIFEPKIFSKQGAAGCNRCGGVISELMVQTLAIEGINLPSSVIRQGINTYNLHTEKGDVFIETADRERTIASVFRGMGPKGTTVHGKESFDDFLLKQAVNEGAVHKPVKIDKVEYQDGKPVLFANDEKVMEADLVIGAVGVNEKSTEIFENAGIGYKSPVTTKTAIAEIDVGRELLKEKFENTIHLFLLPIKGIKFAAMIPKNSYITLCILGKDLNRKKVQTFLDHPAVTGLLPEDTLKKLGCMCLPLINTRAPRVPFADRMVICGDAGSTRLYKDGIGAAYLMGKAAAKTAVFNGVSKEDFREFYLPSYKSLITDNQYGSILFKVTDLYRIFGLLTCTMLGMVRAEQKDPREEKRILSSMLWDMFTGNERYKKVFFRAFKLRVNLSTLKEIFRSVTGGSNDRC